MKWQMKPCDVHLYVALESGNRSSMSGILFVPVLPAFLMILAFFSFTDSAEVIQSRVNDQEGREEFYVHYVGCE